MIKKNQNKQFGLLLSFVIFVFLTIQFYNTNNLNIYISILGVFILIMTFLKPNYLKPLTVLWIKFGVLLGYVVAPIVMAIIFFGVMTPIGIILKLFGKDLLKLKKTKNTKSFWIKVTKEVGSMERQF
jgi:hypothetical protein